MNFEQQTKLQVAKKRKEIKIERDKINTFFCIFLSHSLIQLHRNVWKQQPAQHNKLQYRKSINK